MACYRGNKEVVDALIAAKVDCIASSTKIAPPLHVCAERGFYEIAMLLVAYCPDLVFTTDERKNTALHVAAEWD